MTIENGSATVVHHDNAVSAREVARAILESSPGARMKAAATAQQRVPFAAIARELDELADSDDQFRDRLQDAGIEQTRKWLFEQGQPVTSVADFKAYLQTPSPPPMKGGTVARAFWWGWHVEISHADLVAFVAVATTVNTIVGAIGGGIPSPAQPFIVLAATFIKGALGLLQSLDRGRGVYVSMSWFAPGVFVPTSV